MQPVAILAALVAAGLHAWFFLLESVWFMRPSVWGRFGLASDADARVVRSWAYNQGFYNLFLGIGAAAGVLLAITGDVGPGRMLALFACGSMVAAGVVLVTHNRAFARAAAIQIGPALVAVVALLLDL